ncbi:superfamily II DNA or RNA helicase [Metabacillus crassostreae]|uniref:TOTE conflict system archaeo-eukaryotic primase domain-containing protein n=1 Tax=Metabacillus crassostreae TaxID=929098 RepID=UPI0019560AA2|nr:DEAD/DEAH box helicase [Metabacillus crassostreae]MBM7606319.1 superfamily II DNA or RNA helicase [Metabacillus crassostreae]
MESENLIKQLQLECEQLRSENTYLKKQLSLFMHGESINHYISFGESQIVTKHSSLQSKIKLYRSLFTGREDVYAIRWESQSGKSGYAPACAFEWQKPICLKPQIKCTDCKHRKLLPITNQVLIDHLSGKHVVGLYPIKQNDLCSFLVIDFDKKDWQQDVTAFTKVCKDLELPYSIERSRSGNGAHVWFFFESDIKASTARRLGLALLTKTLEKLHIGIDSYDRMFPNQDTLSEGGFGNLIGLPLQRNAAKQGNSLFVNDDFKAFPDQWIYLSHIRKLTDNDISIFLDNIIRVSSSESSENSIIPKKLTILLKNGLFIKKNSLPSSTITKLIELASIKNPEYFKAQKKRLPTNNMPKIINCSEEDHENLILPRGCQEDVKTLLFDLGIELEFVDYRFDGQPVDLSFHGQLTSLQLEAVSALLKRKNGVLAATTGFGKTVTAAALIAERGVNTLIIVDRTQLQVQWVEKLSTFLNLSLTDIGQYGGGKKKLTGMIDVVTIQSLVSKKELKSFITQYGQIIIDECHHISAFTFERVLKQVRAKYIHGLTATPIRKDGLHPIIFMQSGPIRYKVDSKTQAKVRPFVHKLLVRNTKFTSDSIEIQNIYTQISLDTSRNQQIFDDVLHNLEEGRSPIILTERIEHLEILQNQFKGFVKNMIVLTGNVSKKEQKAELDRLRLIPDNEERLIIATGKYIGEGFDDSRLDTLFLAMPISWKGTLQQYVGRLHRLHDHKQEVRVYDYVDQNVPILAKMFVKRSAGYRNMGYVQGDMGTESAEQMRLF